MYVWPRSVRLKVVVLEEQVQVEGEQAERLQHEEQLVEQRPTGGQRQTHEGAGMVIRLKDI